MQLLAFDRTIYSPQRCRRCQVTALSLINVDLLYTSQPTFMAINIHECMYVSKESSMITPHNHPAIAHRCHFLLFMTVVMACLTTTPALSISLFERPLVTHTFRAGCGRHSFRRSLGVAPIARGMAFRRVMRTPFARAYSRSVSDRHSQFGKQYSNSPRQRSLAAAFPGPTR